MPVAYSYQRFSTPDQLHGDSLRRQQEEAERYCAQEGLTLSEETYRDLGVSAFTGANLEEGTQLSLFLEAVKMRRIAPGSCLLVENFDRLSRQSPLDALPLLQQIVQTGVDVITLHDRKRYTATTLREDFTGLMMSLMQMHLAHEESRKKSKRLTAVYAAKRQRADNHIALPFWVVRSPQDELELHQAYAPVVRRMFELAANEGLGGRAIAARLKQEGHPVLDGRANWAHPTIGRVLRSRSAIGEYQPFTKANGISRRPVGPPLENFYPAVVELGTFLRANANRKPTGPKPIAAGPSNLFSSLLLCRCGSPFHLKRGSKRDPQDRLVCSARCGERSIRYHDLEFHSITGLVEMLQERVEDLKVADMQVPSSSAELAAEIDLKIQRLLTAIEDGLNSPSLMRKLDDLETQKADLSREVEARYQAEEDELGGYDTMSALVGSEYLMKSNDPSFRSHLAASVGRWIEKAELIDVQGKRLIRWRIKKPYWVRMAPPTSQTGYRDLPVEFD